MLFLIFVGCLLHYSLAYVDTEYVGLNTLIVYKYSSLVNNFTLAGLLIVPTVIFFLGIRNHTEQPSSYWTAIGYLVVYVGWLLIPGGTYVLEGGLGLNKNPIIIIGLLLLPSIAYLRTLKEQLHV